MKPIYIYRNQDSIASIGIPSSGSLNMMDVLKKQLSSLFPAEEDKRKEGVDVTKYSEPKIEAMIQEKKK